MKGHIIIALLLTLSSCVTWVQTETRAEVTGNLIGRHFVTEKNAMIQMSAREHPDKISGRYCITPTDARYRNENFIVLEECPPGTRGRIVRFLLERDAGQSLWDYVELEMDDPHLKQRYRIVRILGLHDKNRPYTIEDIDEDFRLVP